MMPHPRPRALVAANDPGAPPRVVARDPRRILLLRALAASMADALLLVAFLQGVVPGALVLAAHLALAAVLAFGRLAGDRTPALVLSASLALFGPAGGVAAALALWRTGAQGTEGERADWYRQLSGRRESDPAVALYEDIVHGRAYASRGMPQNFAAIMAGGSVADRQTVLGLLVKRRQTPPEALLQTGLRSRDVAVRASAAAAVAKLRERAANAALAQPPGTGERP